MGKGVKRGGEEGRGGALIGSAEPCGLQGCTSAIVSSRHPFACPGEGECHVFRSREDDEKLINSLFFLLSHSLLTHTPLVSMPVEDSGVRHTTMLMVFCTIMLLNTI